MPGMRMSGILFWGMAKPFFRNFNLFNARARDKIAAHNCTQLHTNFLIY